MEELSIEEKAKAYDEAYEKAVVRFGSNVADEIFFKESEDERIIKELIEFININTLSIDERHNRWIAWVEKQGERKSIDDLTQQEAMDIAVAKCFEQGEQKSVDKVEPKFRIGDTIRLKNSNAEHIITDISDGYYRGKGWALDIIAADESNDYELVEKSLTAWSEEDEKIIIELVGIFESAIDGGHVSFPYRLIKDYIRVLKSCLSQTTWKPSDEQMKALNYYIKYNVDSDGVFGSQLVKLYQDLLKLR